MTRTSRFRRPAGAIRDDVLVAGRTRRQLMASEEDAAAFVAATLPRLVEVGAIGALIWCFADYDRSLWRRPPLLDARHERFFGLVRPDGSLKPHAEVLRAFAATAPIVRPVPPAVRFDFDEDAFYRDPLTVLRPLYGSLRARTPTDPSRRAEHRRAPVSVGCGVGCCDCPRASRG